MYDHILYYTSNVTQTQTMYARSVLQLGVKLKHFTHFKWVAFAHNFGETVANFMQHRP